ncbi:MAG: hypothetical protein SFY80_07105 [Verrucomicrobiota bacterium]|nr:hypothetical protein [Verrucomicrobiota bacterium]
MSWTAATFALLLQRTPLIKLLAEGQFSAPSRIIQVWQWAITAVAGLAAYDTLAGATTLVTAPSSPISGDVGKSLFVQFTMNGAPGNPQSWSYTGTLPAGLGFYQASSGGSALSGTTFNFSSKNIYLRGTPTQAGNFTLTVTGWENSNARGGAKATTITLNLKSTVAIPATPASIAATDAEAASSITISWAASSGATSYQLFRSDSNNAAAATQITETAATQYTDASLPAGTTYYYWVKAGNTAGYSAFAGPDAGSTALLPPSAPGNVVASDATATDSITISWSGSVGATTYQVFRGTTNSVDTAALLAETISNQYIDQPLGTGTSFYYWVKAGNSAGFSALAGPDAGSTALPAVPEVPANLLASDSTSANSIDISWTASAGATSYEIWCSDTQDIAAAMMLVNVAETTYTYASLQAGYTCYIFVRAKNAGGYSTFVGPAMGRTSPPPEPFQFTAWLQTPDGFVYNQMGFLYSGFFPFVYGFSDENWLYIFTDQPNDTAGYYLYDFKRAQFGYTQPSYYPYYFVVPITGDAVDLNPTKQ